MAVFDRVSSYAGTYLFRDRNFSLRLTVDAKGNFTAALVAQGVNYSWKGRIHTPDAPSVALLRKAGLPTVTVSLNATAEGGEHKFVGQITLAHQEYQVGALRVGSYSNEHPTPLAGKYRLLLPFTHAPSEPNIYTNIALSYATATITKTDE